MGQFTWADWKTLLHFWLINTNVQIITLVGLTWSTHRIEYDLVFGEGSDVDEG